MRHVISGGARPLTHDPWRGSSAPGPGGGGGSGPGGQQADVPKVQFPPIFVPPANAQDFFAAGSQAFAGPVAFGVFAGAGASVQLPPGMAGIIRGVMFLVNNLLITSGISFAIRLSGNPAPGYGNYAMPQAGIAVWVDSPDSDSVYIKVPPGALIQCFAQVTDAVAYNLSFKLWGWMYNKTVDDQWRGVV